MSETREWIIERCTQEWVGNDLIYQDWPFTYPDAGLGIHPRTRSEMIEHLAYAQREFPNHEFRGHNIRNCTCERHKVWKRAFIARGTSPEPKP